MSLPNNLGVYSKLQFYNKLYKYAPSITPVSTFTVNDLKQTVGVYIHIFVILAHSEG